MKGRFSIDIKSIESLSDKKAKEICKEQGFPSKSELLRLEALGIVDMLESDSYCYSDDSLSDSDILSLDNIFEKVVQPDNSAVLVQIKREQWL